MTYKQDLIDFFKEKVSGKFKDEKAEVIIAFMINNDLINKERLRNHMIIKDNDSLRSSQDRKVIDIYDDLAYKYDLSFCAVKKIVCNRRDYEIKGI